MMVIVIPNMVEAFKTIPNNLEKKTGNPWKNGDNSSAYICFLKELLRAQKTCCYKDFCKVTSNANNDNNYHRS